MDSRINFIGSGRSAVLESDRGNGHRVEDTATVTTKLPEAIACKAMAKGDKKVRHPFSKWFNQR